MKRLSKTTTTLFKKWGKTGGIVRMQNLSPHRRCSIASRAARARWGKRHSVSSMPSVRLDALSWKDPVYLEEILAEGGRDEWRELYHHIADHPFGEIADALQKVVHSTDLYGATRLWKSLLSHLQGGTDV